MENQGLSQWLKGKCKEGNLSLREAAAKTDLSHATIQAVLNGGKPSPETIRKLAGGFGQGESLALENYLFELAGYRTPRPEQVSEALAQVIDKVRQLSEPQLKMMVSFANFLLEITPEDAKVAKEL